MSGQNQNWITNLRLPWRENVHNVLGFENDDMEFARLILTNWLTAIGILLQRIKKWGLGPPNSRGGKWIILDYLTNHSSN